LGLTDPSAAADGYEDYVGGVVRKPYVGVDGLKNIQRFMNCEIQKSPSSISIN
jgi:hypothetical protein